MALDSLTRLTGYMARPMTGLPNEDHVTLFSPDDNVHGALLSLIRSVTSSLVVVMYGFDDEDLAMAIGHLLTDSKIYVSLSLDSTQAAGKHEKALLRAADYPSNSVSFGQSREHRITHIKGMVIDGIDVVGGSTNWSQDGESKQDNELTIVRHPVVAARYRQQFDLIHEAQLTQMMERAKRDRVLGAARVHPAGPVAGQS